LYLLCERNNPEKIIDHLLPSNAKALDQENTRKIPLYTAAGAGSGKVAESDILELIGSEIGDFCVKIRGNSMSPVVEDGGVVIIEKINSIEELKRGRMVIVRVNGDEAVLKYLTVDEESAHVVLRSENFDYPPKFLPLHKFKSGDCEVIGKVVEIRSRNIPRG
jgi:SOS-response transcriptional repressor LexA